MKSAEIRQKFLDFFESKGHIIVPSAPMVIKDDPTLMFTNAGMNQFKDIILGNISPKHRRVADSQKCLRVSGKHNDLEEVGHDTYHHTMFEMLGNWSFGDYFKEEAIAYAWEFLTEVMKLDKNRLYATVFEGSQEDGLEQDVEARNIWMNYLPEERILFGNKKDNFWEMGDMGPCGPCSEIHIDLRSEAERELKSGRELVNQDNPLVIEIWNLVFMQYNRKADGSLENLPSALRLYCINTRFQISITNGLLKSGIWYLCNITVKRMEVWKIFRTTMWIPEWDLNGCVWLCKGKLRIMTRMFLLQSSEKLLSFVGFNMEMHMSRMWLCVLLLTIYVLYLFLLLMDNCLPM